jgi:S1-C subfamily serine protease
MTEEQKKAQGLPNITDGVYVNAVTTDGGAYSAGIRKGDIITKVNNNEVNSGLQMSAQIAGFRPGDKVPVTYLRNNKEYAVSVILKKKTDVIAVNVGTRLGADLVSVDKAKARQLGIEGGVLVNKITEGGAISRTRMQEGFVITSVNGQAITSLEDLTKVLSNLTGQVKVDGIYPGYEGPYSYPLNLDQ